MRNIKLAVIFVFVFAVGGLFLLNSGAVTGQVGDALSAPTRVSATDSVYHTKIGIYWDAISGATNYRIFRNSVNDPATAADVGASPVNFFFDNNVNPGQPFFYWVRAENESTVSELSVADTGTRTNTNQQGPVPPLGPPPPAPPGNPLTAAKAELGKVLFWDEQLSSTKTVACGTCHHASSGGADPRSTVANATFNPGIDGLIGTPDDVRGSLGVPFTNLDRTYSLTAPYGLGAQVTNRKTTSFVNAVYSPTLFWDGRASATFRDPVTNVVLLNNGAALESQAIGPPTSTSEMAHSGRDWPGVAADIAAAKPLALSANVPPSLNTWIGGRSYPDLFLEAFGSGEVTPARIAMAIASYQRTQFSDQAKIDLVNAGIATLTAQEQRGRNAFNANSCNLCHSGPQLSDNAFHYIGVRPQNDDLGHFVVTGDPGNRGEFKTPSLRNVGLRTSYFHNGQFTTLEQVVAFYNRGGDFNAPNKNTAIRPLGMNPGTQADLVAFLRNVLTDPRVQAESSVFERPQLYTESNRVPQVIGSGRAGSGGIVPTIHAISPPVAGNPNFTVSVSSAVGASQGFLVIDAVDPGVGTSIPITGSIGKFAVNTNNTGNGNGWASLSLPLPSTAAVIGRTFFARWYVVDPGAVNGFSVSPAARFSIFGEATSSANVTISGRVVDQEGRGIPNVNISLGAEFGGRRRATTSSFGFYSFDNVEPGSNYSLGVLSRTFTFTSINLFVSNDLTDVNFVAQ
ncbi:MAG: carboxypeptidase regulatory-like domain-containing protein [Pyrinomonadaceae bacterium]|nr:carboxypeptidase regulatory-like domain-containing protein [Pyrinomonadaceae bacterium]